jgi:hypothetical protein
MSWATMRLGQSQLARSFEAKMLNRARLHLQLFSRALRNSAPSSSKSFHTALNPGLIQSAAAGIALSCGLAVALTTVLVGDDGLKQVPLLHQGDALEGEKRPDATTNGRIIAVAELRQHRSEDSCWVSYNGIVYDVTEFIRSHPGGCHAILMAGGQALEPFWEHYLVHSRTDKAMRQLEQLPQIGRLSEADAEQVLDVNDPENAACLCPRSRRSSKAVASALSVQRRQLWRLFSIAIAGPCWGGVRILLNIVGLFLPDVVDHISQSLPISVPGFGASRRLSPFMYSNQEKERRARVAVIGGGIAGVGCAYALANSGFEVEIFESRDVLGGIYV